MGQPTVLEAYKAARFLLICKVVGAAVVLVLALVFFLMVDPVTQANIAWALLFAVGGLGAFAGLIIGLPLLLDKIERSSKIVKAAKMRGVREDD